MSNYEVTYHFTNGEVIKVKYRGVITDKLSFVQLLTDVKFFGDKEMKILVNTNQVNYMEVKGFHKTEGENKDEI